MLDLDSFTSIASLKGHPGWLTLMQIIGSKEESILDSMLGEESGEKLQHLARYYQAFRGIREILETAPEHFATEIERQKKDGFITEDGMPITSQAAWLMRFGQEGDPNAGA